MSSSAKRIGDHRRASGTSSTATLLAVAGVGVVQAVPRVLDLHLPRSPRALRRTRSMRRRASIAKYAGLVAPSRWKRSQSGSFLRSPPTGGEEALGRGVGADDQGDRRTEPARICARAACERLAIRWRRRHTTTKRARRSSRASGRTSLRRRSLGSRCGWCRRRDEPDLAPVEVRPRRPSARAAAPYSVEVGAPLAPWVHAGAQDVQQVPGLMADPPCVGDAFDAVVVD